MNLKMLSAESQAQKAHSGNPISIHFGKGKTIVVENRLWGPGVKDGEGLATERQPKGTGSRRTLCGPSVVVVTHLCISVKTELSPQKCRFYCTYICLNIKST